MRGNMFDDSFEVLKSLVNELGGATPRAESGAPRRVNPTSKEKFHLNLQQKRNELAREIAEQNLTPNAVLDQRMSSTPRTHPSDFLEGEEQDTVIPRADQFGYSIADSQRMKRNFENPFGQPEEKSPSMMEMQRNRFIQNPPQGPLSLQDLRQFPENPVNPFKLKSSPFDLAWTILKEDVNYLQDAIYSIQRMFGVDYDEAMRMVEQMHSHQLSQAGIPQDKIDRQNADDGYPASDYINQQFAKPMAIELSDMANNLGEVADYQQYKDDNSRRIGQRTSNEAVTNRPRSSPRVPQMSEEASYANISVPRESPIHGIEPFGEDEPMGATLPEPRRMSPLGESPMPQRSEDPPNPFKQESPTTKRLKEMVGQMNMRSKKPLELEGAGERTPIEFPQNLPMSQGPSRQQRRGMPGAGVPVKRPGFRGPSMPMTDTSAENRM